MKKIFPIITVLVFVSLLGIIFFQIVWIRQALQDKELQFEEAIKMVTIESAKDLVNQKAKMSPFESRRNADLLFPLNVFPTTIAHNFSLHEIRDLI
jgi:two-component system phosphate regulon sensor histidine kinase PhoR